jgi:hypothetical protein
VTLGEQELVASSTIGSGCRGQLLVATPQACCSQGQSYGHVD